MPKLLYFASVYSYGWCVDKMEAWSTAGGTKPGPWSYQKTACDLLRSGPAQPVCFRKTLQRSLLCGNSAVTGTLSQAPAHSFPGLCACAAWVARILYATVARSRRGGRLGFSSQERAEDPVEAEVAASLPAHALTPAFPPHSNRIVPGRHGLPGAMPLPDTMFCAQQIHIPPELPDILKQFTKAAIRTQPVDVLQWSAG